MRQELYRLTDSFLVEAKDQNGNSRSLERLNRDRHLFVANMIELISERDEEICRELEGRKDAFYSDKNIVLDTAIEVVRKP